MLLVPTYTVPEFTLIIPTGNPSYVALNRRLRHRVVRFRTGQLRLIEAVVTFCEGSGSETSREILEGVQGAG